MFSLLKPPRKPILVAESHPQGAAPAHLVDVGPLLPSAQRCRPSPWCPSRPSPCTSPKTRRFLAQNRLCDSKACTFCTPELAKSLPASTIFMPSSIYLTYNPLKVMSVHHVRKLLVGTDTPRSLQNRTGTSTWELEHALG